MLVATRLMVHRLTDPENSTYIDTMQKAIPTLTVTQLIGAYAVGIGANTAVLEMTVLPQRR